ncbi:hypothetical protein BJ508DRAFT_411567 [Ascobolus immersus RN42]|uniref:Uncharacterized protein n=1 Tax=Ascobolus immersus RN42 TaxID=1160509 RepID=A0A3N4IWF3_ASCIM|nr:hypothetical protein BJ508DRAFT_411567 [Ascobolus immersus RN42]
MSEPAIHTQDPSINTATEASANQLGSPPPANPTTNGSAETGQTNTTEVVPSTEPAPQGDTHPGSDPREFCFMGGWVQDPGSDH